jgi:hypothetical protein
MQQIANTHAGRKEPAKREKYNAELVSSDVQIEVKPENHHSGIVSILE